MFRTNSSARDLSKTHWLLPRIFALAMAFAYGWASNALATPPAAEPASLPSAMVSPEVASTLTPDLVNSTSKTAANANAVQSTGKIIAVTVLPDGAWITREVLLARGAGDQPALELTNLPSSVQQDSVQFEGSQIKVAGSVQWQMQPVAQSSRYLELIKSIDREQQTHNLAADTLEAAHMRLAIFQAQMGNANPVSAKAGAAAGAFLTEPAARKKFDQLLTQLIDAQRAAQTRVNESQVAIASLQTAVKQLEAQGDRLMLRVPLHILAAKDTATPASGGEQGSTAVLVRYRVSDAHWQPVYRADLRTHDHSPSPESTPASANAATNAEVNWSLDALVQQTTGEDWSHVPLTLSVLDQRQYTPVPKLPRWTIGFNAPSLSVPHARVAVAAPMSAVAMNEAVLTPQDATGFNATFQSIKPVSITSGAGQSLIPLLHQAVGASATALVVPAITPQAVLTAEFTLDHTIPLPAGQWQLFLNGTQVGQVHQAAIKLGQSQRLSFGVDQRIAVTYDAMPDQRDENGVIGKSSQLIRRSVVTVQSQHTSPVSVTVVLNAPTAIDAEISVEPLADNTPPTTKQFRGQDGAWSWSNQIKPDQKLSINFGFRVRWPADKTLFGL